MLITKFGSVRAIRDLPAEELAAAPGIGPALAKRILAKLNEDGDENINNMPGEETVNAAAKEQN